MDTGKEVRDMTLEMDRQKQREREGEILTVKAKGRRGWGVLNVLIHRNTASNQCTALRLAEQLRGVRQQYIHVATEGQREGAEQAS